jgi:TM2 domain-containing membrane protein YozV
LDLKNCFKNFLIVFSTIVLILNIFAHPLSGQGTSIPPSGQDGEVREDFYIEEPERKDPFIAGLLSWSWSGLGQFYTQEYTYGSLFLLADIAQKGLLVYMIFYYSDKYTSDNDDIVKWQDIEGRDKGIIIGYIFSMLFVKVLCIVNAVDSAEKYNREIYFPFWKNRSRVGLSLHTEDDRINIGLSTSL